MGKEKMWDSRDNGKLQFIKWVEYCVYHFFLQPANDKLLNTEANNNNNSNEKSVNIYGKVLQAPLYIMRLMNH